MRPQGPVVATDSSNVSAQCDGARRLGRVARDVDESDREGGGRSGRFERARSSLRRPTLSAAYLAGRENDRVTCVSFMNKVAAGFVRAAHRCGRSGNAAAGVIEPLRLVETPATFWAKVWTLSEYHHFSSPSQKQKDPSYPSHL